MKIPALKGIPVFRMGISYIKKRHEEEYINRSTLSFYQIYQICRN